MMEILSCFIGFCIGTAAGIVTVALLGANKPDDIEYEKTKAYKKGFEDGCQSK
jgi:hypothetical protein